MNKTISAQKAYDLALWEHDDPILSFPSDDATMLENGEHIVIEMWPQGDGYMATCCICGGAFLLTADTPMTLTPANDHWVTEGAQ